MKTSPNQQLRIILVDKGNISQPQDKMKSQKFNESGIT